MFFDLNVPVVVHQSHGTVVQSKKNKGKQSQLASTVVFNPVHVAAIEARIDLLIHLGYTVIAFNQTVEKKIDPKTHVNILDKLLPQLKHRTGVVFLKRLTIHIDEDSEKGFGLTSGNMSITDAYHLIALVPTTQATFSAACLTHSQPSSLTAHIIALPLALPRFPFPLKPTLVRTAIKNGAVFEISYAGALGDPASSHTSLSGMSDVGITAKRNWWATAREVVRVTKGKGVIVSGGVIEQSDYRGPKDIQNLTTLLGLAQNLAHDACAVTPKSLVLRAQTRKTYRAVFSEPRVVVPSTAIDPTQATSTALPSAAVQTPARSSSMDRPPVTVTTEPSISNFQPQTTSREEHITKKRRREPDSNPTPPEKHVKSTSASTQDTVTRDLTSEGAPARKKKKKRKESGIQT